MGDNLFRGRLGVVFAILAVALFFGAFYFGIFARNVIWIVFFIIFGGIYFWNFKRTEASKHLVSSIIFWLAGVFAIFNLFLGVSWRAIWLVTIILYVLSGPIAALIKGFGSGQEKMD